MPYVKQARRDKILERIIGSDGVGRKIDITEIQNAGELNYALTETILEFIRRQKQGYQAINDVLGALEGAKLELYRRLASPYEDIKIKENGDVYPETEDKAY